MEARVQVRNIVGAVGLGLFLLGSASAFDRPKRAVKVEAVCPTLFDVKALYVLVLVIDRSGTVQDNAGDRLRTVRADAVSIIQRLPPATVVLGRFISDQSYRDSEVFLADAIPGEPGPVQCTNPFDPRCQREKRLRALLSACPAEARKRIAEKVWRLNPLSSRLTDIWGGVMAVGEAVGAYPRAVRRVVFYTDGRDNVGTRLPDYVPGLKDVHMILRTTRSASPERMHEAVSIFRSRVTRWGANVQVVPIEVPSRVEAVFSHNGVPK
jgi:hypothetical protein